MGGRALGLPPSRPVLAALGLLAALLYGSADFAGGMASRRARAVAVVLWSQVAGTLVLLPGLVVLGRAPIATDVGWGLAAGASGAVGMVLLYRGLARGPIGIVSPVTAVCAALVPVVGGTLLGEQLGAAAWGGVLLGLVAVVLLSAVPAEVPEGVPVAVQAEAGAALAGSAVGRPAEALAHGLGAGSSFGLFFLLLDRTRGDAGLWPLLGARASSLPLLAVVALASGGVAVPRPAWRLALVAGAVDMAANVVFLVATRHGAVGAVAVLVALAPAATVGWAALVLRECVRPVQLVGLAVAAGAVTLMALR